VATDAAPKTKNPAYAGFFVGTGIPPDLDREAAAISPSITSAVIFSSIFVSGFRNDPAFTPVLIAGPKSSAMTAPLAAASAAFIDRFGDRTLQP
jgi:hypothetical protein